MFDYVSLEEMIFVDMAIVHSMGESKKKKNTTAKLKAKLV